MVSKAENCVGWRGPFENYLQSKDRRFVAGIGRAIDFKVEQNVTVEMFGDIEDEHRIPSKVFQGEAFVCREGNNMFEQDYIMRILVQFGEAIRRSMVKANKEQKPIQAAEMLEGSIGESVDIDGKVLLSLAPESIAGVMQVSGTDPQVAEYIARSLLLDSQYLREGGLEQKAQLREKQAYAIGEAFGFEVFLDMLTEEEWEKFFSKDEPEA